MPTASRTAPFRVLSSIRDIPRGEWDACANPEWALERPLDGRDLLLPLEGGEETSLESPQSPYNPFISHDFLLALEASGSATARTGWAAQHIVMKDGAGRPEGVMPLYLKSHSMGEYVFDQGWAEAYQRAGGRYYPKLQAAIPFTPVPGPRLMVRPGADAEQRRLALAAAAVERIEKAGASSVHATFLPEAEWQLLGQAGWLRRTDQQFHFENEGYRDFGDFLAALSSMKRKNVKRERRDALAGGVEVVSLTGSELTEVAWDAFFTFYMETGSRKWGRPYLNRKFFSLIGESMPDRVLLVLARREGRYIAGALNFIGSDTLYGRYWGATEHRPFLHFEVCYYQAIDWALAHGLRRVEAGAQGDHKIARGYRPVTTYSAHYIADPGLRRGVAAFLERERREVAMAHEEYSEHVPFRRNLEEEAE